MINALTVDVEDYFHPNAMDDVVPPSDWDGLPHRVESNTYRVLDLLSEHEVQATFFFLGWVAERWPALVVEAAKRGHEIACHGYAHRLVSQLGRKRFRSDVERARDLLQNAVGQPIAGFRAASYSILSDTLWALDILIDLGFLYDSSIFPVRHDIYGIPRFSRIPVRVQCKAGEIVEIPASTVRWMGRNWPVAGGGYFRLFPYWMTRSAMRRLNEREHLPATVYVHPWELDPEQPRLPAGRRARLRQYTNLDKTEPRLRRLLGEYRFAPVREAFRPYLDGRAEPWDIRGDRSEDGATVATPAP